jgi:GTP pyrophosphokinase
MVAITRPFALSIAETHDLEAWRFKLSTHYSAEEMARIDQALTWAKDSYHNKVLPVTQEPLFSHAVATAAIVVDLGMDCDAVCATLLFSLAECNAQYKDIITKQMGGAVAELAEGINKVSKIHMLAQPKNVKHDEVNQQMEAMRKMLLAIVEDIRVVLVKLAWRTQTMHYLQQCPSAIQQSLAQETLDIFAPLANRLGIWQVKWELEDLSFRFLEPQLYKKIAQLLDERRIDREQFISNVLTRLRAELAQAGIRADLMGRPKHIYSIYKKMQKKRLDFSHLYDIRAVRILVDDVKACYMVLGIVHHIWQPIPGEFDDYISHPKGNDYRSLHTAVIGPDDKAVEVQIRTFDMHEHAEHGVAAHWRYKEGGKSNAQYEAKIAWIRQLLDWREDVHQGKALADAFKTELFDDAIYVITPAGKVITLPTGSTPIDFAYHVHTDLGHRCRGAKVDGHIVPLHTPLKNGQRVEIIAAKEGTPSIDWLHQGYLKSPRAISKVRHWMRQQNIDVAIDTGRTLFEREAVKAGISHPNIEHIAETFRCKNTEDFFAALGQNEISLREVHQALQNTRRPHDHTTQEVTANHIIRSGKAKVRQAGVLIEGVDELMTLLAKCCKPVPPDIIMGFVTKGRGVSIHRTDCPSLQRLVAVNPERIISADWGKNSGNVFAVDLLIIAIQRPTLLRDLSDILAREKVNITSVNTLNREHRTKLYFTIEIQDMANLQRVMHRLREVPTVINVVRG